MTLHIAGRCTLVGGGGSDKNSEGERVKGGVIKSGKGV